MAQGGDWGATIANWIGHDHSKFCKAIHINCLNDATSRWTTN